MTESIVCAAQKGQTAHVTCLLATASDLELEHALCMAAANDRVDVVCAMLESCDGYGLSIGAGKVAREVLSKVNPVSSALKCAVRSGAVGCVRALVEYGAKSDLKRRAVVPAAV